MYSEEERAKFRKRFDDWKNGKKPYDGGKIAEIVITPDEEYNLFLNTLPDNQRLTPESEYTTHRYWELNDKPKNFSLAILRGMYTILPDGWHANTVLENKSTGELEFMKPWNHPSIKQEYDWYRSDDAKQFRKNYKHVPSAPNAKYIPKYELGTEGGLIGSLPINIPVALKGMYKAIKKRAYDTITPQDYNIPKATKEFVSGKSRDKSAISPVRNEEWARYLGVKYDGESGFEPSPYRPKKGKTYKDVLRFKDESLILSDLVLNQMLEYQKKTGKNSLLIDGNGGGLGSYTISLGEDEKGKYISYYDDWDINPFKGISAKYNIPILSTIEDIVPGSNPYTIYGRRYYK